MLTLGLLSYLAYTLLGPQGDPLPALGQSGYSGQPTLWQDDAPLKLILFENFLCEHCKALEQELFPQLKRDYVDTGKVELYYVNLAWGEGRSVLAGLAGECAYQQDEALFWDYKTALYDAQESWQDVSDLATLAANSGLDGDDQRTCVAEERYAPEVQRDLDLAERVGIDATPSLVLGDRGFQGPSYETLRRVLDAELGTR